MLLTITIDFQMYRYLLHIKRDSVNVIYSKVVLFKKFSRKNSRLDYILLFVLSINTFYGY